MSTLKGRKQSPEHIAKRVASIRASGGLIRTPEHREKLRIANLGKKQSKETKRKKSETMKRLGILPPVFYGENHPAWKGDKVTYRNLHSWIERQLGKPSECKGCGITSLKRYHWANISREYKRDISDWIRLCPKCHKQYDVYDVKTWESKVV
jgi:hypothetical protein